MVHVSRNTFEDLVLQALDNVPARLRDRIENLDVIVKDWPAKRELASAGLNERRSLLGLYEGVPLTARSHYNLVIPDKITIYQRPIEALSQTRKDITENVRKTLIHEIAHHFGIDDTRLLEFGSS